VYCGEDEVKEPNGCEKKEKNNRVMSGLSLRNRELFVIIYPQCCRYVLFVHEYCTSLVFHFVGDGSE
jgi:hypothetical protein